MFTVKEGENAFLVTFPTYCAANSNLDISSKPGIQEYNRIKLLFIKTRVILHYIVEVQFITANS